MLFAFVNSLEISMHIKRYYFLGGSLFFCCNGSPYTGTLAHIVEPENERMCSDRVIVG